MGDYSTSKQVSKNTDPDPIRIQGFNDLKLKKKITAGNKKILDQKLPYNLPIARPP
jgi:hypothetical protein